jgi:hypothetical protein
MSNRVALQATEFVNLPGRGRSVGFRAWDDEGQTYDDTFESIQSDPLDFLRQVLETGDPVFREMMEFVRGNRVGMFINGDWHRWEQLERVVTDFYDVAAAREGRDTAAVTKRSAF